MEVERPVRLDGELAGMSEDKRAKLYMKMCARYARSAGLSREDADDCGVTFAVNRFVRERDNPKLELHHPMEWIHLCARHHVLGVLRARQTLHSHEVPMDPADYGSGQSPGEIVERAELKRRILQAIYSLDETLRILLYRHHIEAPSSASTSRTAR